MKKTILTILIMPLMIVAAYAQTPQALNYQAVARNSLGQIVPSQNIGVRFTIQDATGNNVYYQETHATTTNNFGLFTLAIGKGTAVSGGIAAIDWSAGGDKFLKVEIAPQGGTNYTIQGVTQLLSVPYALYSEKTKLVAGNAITITNGNTISANYVAGAGINITGNVISSTINAWLLNGNAATTVANFLGTTDNKPLNLRTNNMQRFSISESNVVGTNNIAYISAGQQSDFATNPVQLGVWGKDMAGSSLPFGVAGNVTGMTWGTQLGNTLGRLMRLTQFTTSAGPDYQFFDVGIDQAGDYYVGEHQLWTDGNVIPKKMLTISPSNFVGINFGWGEHPTANFHTKGSVRFEGVNTNNALTRVVVMDATGNVSSRDASTLGGGGSGWLLTGNAGTTAANYLGTNDNQPLRIRTNNITRASFDAGVVDPFSGNVGTFSISDPTSVATAPGQLGIYGKDIPGVSMNAFFANYVQGMNWAPQGGSNNTMGRFLRLLQVPTSNVSDGEYYDFGMDQGKSFFISERGFQNGGPVFFKKMITITPQDFVGINFNWGEDPTANFHTKGTVRFEGIAANNALTRVMVMDNNGNVSSRDASTLGGGGGSGWLLSGNAGTTATNYLGTSDNQPLRIRTNNIARATFDAGVIDPFSGNVGTFSISDQTSVATAPGQLGIYGKDIPGVSMNAFFANYVQGMNWAPQGGSNNTMGRFLRLLQVPTANVSDGEYYDFGMDQGKSFFISERGFQNGGPVFFKKMITITPTDFVGINFNWGEDPTANFHTKGTVRFQNLPTGTGNILVVDANGNVFRASQTASKTAANDNAIQTLQNELNEARKEIAELKSLMIELQKKMNTGH